MIHFQKTGLLEAQSYLAIQQISTSLPQQYSVHIGSFGTTKFVVFLDDQTVSLGCPLDKMKSILKDLP